MPSEFRRLALLGLAATAAAERCNVDAVVVHCEARCAGVNATSFSASNPAGTMLQPPAAGRNLFLAQLESSDERPTPLGGAPMIFTQLQEGAAAKPPASQGGSPSAISAVDAATFTEGTVYAPVHEPLSPDQLIGAIGPADKIEWQSAASGTLRCVDGRYATAGSYAHGGDFGEFLLALTAYEHMLQKQLNQARAQFWARNSSARNSFGRAQLGRAIRRAGAAPTQHAAPLPSLSQAETGELFSAYLGKFSSSTFSYCTDDDAVRRLADAVGAGRKLDMRRPPLEYQASLMVRSASPEYVGSEHIKWMLEQPKMYTVREAAREGSLGGGAGRRRARSSLPFTRRSPLPFPPPRYQVRRELIAQLTREFFAILWNDYHPLHARLSLDVLGGPHVERALVRVRGGMWCAAEQGVVPAVAAKTRAGAAFVVSTQAIELRRAELVTFFSQRVSPAVEPNELKQRISALGDGQGHLTEKAMAGMLRSYAVLVQ